MVLSDRTVLVTGGASGLGGATADMVVAAGGRAVILDRNAAAGEARARALGDRARFVVTDVTSEADVRAAIDTATRAFGQIDGLVNAAGIVLAARVLGREGPQRARGLRQGRDGQPGRHLQRDPPRRRTHRRSGRPHRR